MKLDISTITILRQSAEHGAACGVAQIRATDERGRVKREGAVALLQQGDGREVRTLFTPDEARELGAQLISASFIAADAPPPIFQAPPPPVVHDSKVPQ